MGEISRVSLDRNLTVKPDLISGVSESISMPHTLPVVYLARHGNTVWTHSGQHTGLTDLPLTPDGERNAVRLGERLKGLRLAKVFTSPLQRAARTCELAGFGAAAQTDPDLVGFVMAARKANRHDKSENERTVWCNGYAALLVTCCSFPAGILFVC